MEYVLGSVAALVSGNVTPSRPKHLKRALTPTKHQPSPNVTPKSELVDRSIFLSPTLQKKKAIAKKSPKRIFENQNLDITEEELNLVSPKADKVKKHLEIELDAKTSVNSSLLSPESPKETSEMKKSPKNVKVMNAAAHVYENTPPKNNKRKLTEDKAAKNAESNDVSPKKKNKQERKPLSQDVTNVNVQQKAAQSPKKNNKPQQQQKPAGKINNYKNNKKPQNQVPNSQAKQKQEKQKPVQQSNKINKPAKKIAPQKQEKQKPIQQSNKINKPAEKITPQSPQKQNKKNNRKNKKNILKSAPPKPEPKVQEPESDTESEDDDEDNIVNPNDITNNDSDDETEPASDEGDSDDDEDDDDEDDDDEDDDEDFSVNPNAVTNKDSDSEHESDDEIESENDEANKQALEPEVSSDDDEEEEKDTKKKPKAKPVKKDPKEGLSEEQKSEVLEDEIKRTVFVGNVPFSKKCKKDIKKIFIEYGAIETIRIRTVPVKDATVTPKVAVIKNELHPERSTVNVYVKFADESSVEKALKANNTVLNGNHLRVHRTGTTGSVHDPKLSVFVGNIPFGLEDEGLRVKFEKCGAIESVRIIRDRKKNAGKGFGYVNFESKDGVELALAMSEEDLTIKNRILRVKRCTHTEKRNKDTLPKKFVNNFQPNGKVQTDDGKKNNGAYRRIEMKRKIEARADGPPNKRANFNQPREKKQRKEFVGMTAEKKQKRKFDKGQKKKKVLGQILAKK